MKTIVFAILMLVGCVAFGQTKEVLIVSSLEFGLNINSIHIFSEGQEIEKIEFKKPGQYVEKTKALSEIFSRLYKEGWGIVEMSADEDYGLYIFEREKP